MTLGRCLVVTSEGKRQHRCQEAREGREIERESSKLLGFGVIRAKALLGLGRV
jgi:hypothetical protein